MQLATDALGKQKQALAASRQFFQQLYAQNSVIPVKTESTDCASSVFC